MKTIITFIFVFGLIVLVHEFGHFIFAKRGGILVREFSIGMGPKLFSHRVNGTAYSLRLLPIGGYVRMAGAGDDEIEMPPGMPVSLQLNDAGEVVKINTSKKVELPNSIPIEVTDYDLEDKLYIKGYENRDESVTKEFKVDHDATIIEEDGVEVQIAPIDVQFQSAKLGRRMLTNFAGPLNNFILAFVLFVIVAFIQGGTYVPGTSTVIGGILQDSPAQSVGIEPGDEVTSVAGKKVSNADEMIKEISSHPAEKIELGLKNEKGVSRTVKVTPEKDQANPNVGKIGINVENDFVKLSFLGKIKLGAELTVKNSLNIFKALGDLITGFSLNKLGGPVMIFKLSEQVSKNGFLSVLIFTATLSVNLGIMNLVPLPGLDGGKLLLNIYEGLRGKPLSQEKEMIITMAGVAVLVVLMIAVTWNDFHRFFIK